MSRPNSDRAVLEQTWRTYAEEFADHVGDVVTPDEHVETDEQVSWAAQVFMFGYGLGSVAGANAVAPGLVGTETDAERVDRIVDTVTDISGSEEFDASSTTVTEDLLD